MCLRKTNCHKDKTNFKIQIEILKTESVHVNNLKSFIRNKVRIDSPPPKKKKRKEG